MGKETDAKLYKIELNGVGDHIDISTADTYGNQKRKKSLAKYRGAI